MTVMLEMLQTHERKAAAIIVIWNRASK